MPHSADLPLNTSRLSGHYQPCFDRAWLHPRYWPTWLAAGIMRLSVYIPRVLMAGIGVLLGDIYRLTNNKRLQIVQTNIALAFPECSPAQRARLAREHFRVLMQCMLDVPILWWARPGYLDRYVRIKGLEEYRRQYEAGKNIVLLSGHFVGLEMGGSIITRHFPNIGLIKPLRNPVIDWLIARGRSRFGAQLFLRDKGMRSIVKAIKSGYGFYYLPDEDHGHEKSVFVPLLGTDVAMITGAARLIAISNAVAMPAYVRRLPWGRGYELIIHPPLENFPTGKDQEDAFCISKELEKSILDVPAQYMWTYRLFHTRPDNEKSPYVRARDQRRKR